MSDELVTIIDHIRWAASRFHAAGLSFGHSYDNALDEASHLVLHTLHMPHDLPPAYGVARLTADERAQVCAMVARRIDERMPTAYLTGEAWFCGLPFDISPAVLVPRSPIAEMIREGFQPWLGDREVMHALDLCTGSGCIGIAMAVNFPEWQVDLADLSAAALAIARTNIEHHDVGDRVRAIESDLFAALAGTRYDLIVSNPPYVARADVDALPAEYAHEPRLGLQSGEDGLDIPLRILRDAPAHLSDHGLLILEVGDSDRRLRALLPDLPMVWVEFSVGSMGVAVIERDDLLAHADAINAALAARGLS
ncbi:MAG TPA: 50S ribosomal protein L3 N(5)-glutamine methyltransferase [Xanthomonadaceae bacterium]|nr:50S ribosomal protein L3 N(5)-glutamine methyltransferase [Xanthomonadaceae bacterium]